MPSEPPPLLPNPGRGPDGDPVSTIIPFKNGFALAAYYCGVFGLIPCVGFFLGIAAVVLGVLGYRRVRAMPESKGTAHAIIGIVLGSVEVILHLVAIVGMYIAANSPR